MTNNILKDYQRRGIECIWRKKRDTPPVKGKITGDGLAIGVIRDVEAPTYNDSVYAQLEEVSGQKKYHNFAELLETNDIWEVK